MTATDLLTATASRIADAFHGSLPVRDLYSPEGARMYDAFTQEDHSEVREFLRLARGCPGPILDLACGSGRLTLPLRALGRDITALDSSSEMLRILSERLTQARAHVTGQVNFVEADMADFRLDHRFGLVLLGATSITLLDRLGRAALFERVNAHLLPDGRFLLTALEFDGCSDIGDETVRVVIAKNGTDPALHLFTEQLDPAQGIRTVSILRQTLHGGEVTHSELFTTRVHTVTVESLRAELEAAGLAVHARHPVATGGSAYRVTLLECSS